MGQIYFREHEYHLRSVIITNEERIVTKQLMLNEKQTYHE
jgi:hypothetical protein